jgi:hypothetical protein
VFRKIGNEGGAVGVAALGVAEGVHFQHDAIGDAQLALDVVAGGDRLRIGQGFGRAQDLGADLVELAGAAGLGALVAEHRAGIEHLARQGLGKALADEGAADAGGALGRSTTSSPPRSVKAYISLLTTSEVSPRPRRKTRASSKIGVAHSSKP